MIMPKNANKTKKKETLLSDNSCLNGKILNYFNKI